MGEVHNYRRNFGTSQRQSPDRRTGVKSDALCTLAERAGDGDIRAGGQIATTGSESAAARHCRRYTYASHGHVFPLLRHVTGKLRTFSRGRYRVRLTSVAPRATTAATSVYDEDDDYVEIQNAIGTRALEEQSSPHHPLISGEERELLRGEWSDG
ncbi:hypothetical protein MRX96_058163 [Rhipicephalus microplus]